MEPVKINALADIFLRRQALDRIGLQIGTIIKRRTAQGYDYHGQKFQYYSKGHMKKRSAEDLPIANVDLHFSMYDGMMDRIDYSIDNNLVTMYFSDEKKEQLAFYHNVSGAGRSRVIREFWNLSESEMAQVMALYEEDMNAILKELESNG
jgi:hypothetical protein